MGVIRKDYFLERYVYYASKRGKRPKEFKKTFAKQSQKTCFFCPKIEHLTPPEIGRVEYKGKWHLRWFKNKFPAVEQKRSSTFKGKTYFKQSFAYGVHEIIVETPHHKSELGDLPTPRLVNLLQVYRTRIKELSKEKGIKFVHVFKNHGGEAGTSIIHEHSQVIALSQIPLFVKEKWEAIKKLKKDPYDFIIKKEMKSPRKIKENKRFACFAPYASRYNYEVWILPKRHITSFEEFEPEDYDDLAEIMKHILVKLKSLNASYNFSLFYSPKGMDMRFHIEITPRIATYGGFELGTGLIINSVYPEDAAKFYREKN